MRDQNPREILYPTGERRIFRRTADETGGALLEMEVTYNPNSSPPPVHFHPHQEEHFEVLAGQFRVNFAGEERLYGSGETFRVPTAAPHWMYNESPEEGRVIWQVRPALRTQEFFLSMWRAGKDRKNARPNLLHQAVILQEYRIEYVPAAPPPVLQRVLFGVLAPIGRLFGYTP